MSYNVWQPREDVNALGLFMESGRNKKDLIKTGFVFSLLLRELTWLHTNPSIYCVEKFENIPDLYFVKDEETSLRNIETIKRSLKEGNSKIVFIRGKKGSGKTFSLGYFLNKETRNLNKQGITWFRIDATKIYELYYTYPNIFNMLANKKILLESYLYSQIFFVFSRYHNMDSVLKSVDFNEIIEESAKDAALKLKKPVEELKEVFIELKNKAGNAPKFDNSLKGKPWIELYSEDYFVLLKIFSQKLLSFLKKRKKQVVLFLDGIDNVDYDLEHLEYVLEEVYNLLWGNKIELQNYFSKIILLSRPEIYEKILSNVKAQPYSIEVRDLKPVPIEKILLHISSLFDKKKIEKLSEEVFKGLNLEKIINTFINLVERFIETSFKEDLNDLNLSLKERILEELSINDKEAIKAIKAGYIIILILSLMEDYKFQKFLKNLEAFKKYFSNSFREKLKEISKFLKEKYQYNLFDKGELTDSYIWSEIFRDNIRDIFLSLLYSYFYIEAYINQRKFPYSSIESYFEAYDFNDKKDIQDEVKNRRLKIILEAVFKFGKKYAPWNSDKAYIPPYSSFPFLNFFNPSYINVSDISPFYSLIIIDKLLEIKKNNLIILKEELLPNVIGNEDLNLKNKLERKILSPLMEFGYIFITADNRITLTSKGIFAFCSFLTDINVMTSNIFYGLFNDKISEKVFSSKSPPFKLYSEISKKYLSSLLYNLHTLLAYLYEETRELQWFKRFKNLIDNNYVKKMFFEFEKFLELNEREKAFYELSLENLRKSIKKKEILDFLQEILYEKEKKEEDIFSAIREEMPIVLKGLIDMEWKRISEKIYENLSSGKSKNLNVFQIYKLFKIPKDIAKLELYKFIGYEKYEILKKQYENIYENQTSKDDSDKQDIFSLIQALYLYLSIKKKIAEYYKKFQQDSKKMDVLSFLKWLKERNIINPS